MTSPLEKKQMLAGHDAFEAVQQSLLPDHASGDNEDNKAFSCSVEYDTNRDFILENLKTSLHELDNETARDILKEYGSVAANDPDFKILKERAEFSFETYGFKSEILFAIDATPIDDYDALEKYYTQLLRFEPNNAEWRVCCEAAKQRITYTNDEIKRKKLTKKQRKRVCPVTAKDAALPLPNFLVRTVHRFSALAAAFLPVSLAILLFGINAFVGLIMLLSSAAIFAFSLPSSQMEYMALRQKQAPISSIVFVFLQIIVLIFTCIAMF